MTNELAKQKILLVDDETLILYTLSEILRDDRTDITAVTNGADALTAVKSEHYDVCMIDIHLPDMSGLQVMERLREMSPSTTVLMMTGNEVDEALKKSIGEQAYLLLIKPFDLFYVKAIVNKLMKRGATPGEEQVPPIRWATRDKRRYVREPMSQSAVFCLHYEKTRSSQAEFKASVVDISEAGIGLRTVSPLEPGRVVIFKDNFKEAEEKTLGMVLWSMVDESREVFRSGLLFL